MIYTVRKPSFARDVIYTGVGKVGLWFFCAEFAYLRLTRILETFQFENDEIRSNFELKIDCRNISNAVSRISPQIMALAQCN